MLLIRSNSNFSDFSASCAEALASVGGAVETGSDAVRETSRTASRAVDTGSRAAAAVLQRRAGAARSAVMRWAAGDPAAAGKDAGDQTGSDAAGGPTAGNPAAENQTAGNPAAENQAPENQAAGKTRPAWSRFALTCRDLAVRAGAALRAQGARRPVAVLAAATSLAIGAAVTTTATSAQPPLPLMRAESVSSVSSVRGGEPGPEDAAGGTGSTLPEETGEAAPAGEPEGASMPVDNPRITSNFGMRYTFGSEFHTGTDFGAETGTPVKAARAGTVIYAHWHHEGGGGLRVVIDHGDGFCSTYNHLDDIHVGEGQQVGFAECIGTVGSTGNSTGPHLHFEVLRDGDYIDPMEWLAA